MTGFAFMMSCGIAVSSSVKGHLFLYRPLHSYETDPELVLEQLSNRVLPSCCRDGLCRLLHPFRLCRSKRYLRISTMSLSVSTLVVQRHVKAEPFVQFESSHRREIISLGIKKQPVEEIFRSGNGRAVRPASVFYKSRSGPPPGC